MEAGLRKIVPHVQLEIRKNVLQRGNLCGAAESKASWAKSLNLPREGEYLFFAGCGYQFMKHTESMLRAGRMLGKVGIGIDASIGMGHLLDKIGLNVPTMTGMFAREPDSYAGVLISAVKILHHLGIDVAYLGEGEPCCGSPLYYSGFLGDFIELANKNHELFQSTGIQNIIGFIPACTSSLVNLYPNYIHGYGIKVRHFLDVVVEQIRRKNLKPKLGRKMVVTYHDPCQLSRYLQMTEQPRQILLSIEGLELREPEVMGRGRWSTCCGGGGLEATSPDLSLRMGLRRVEELAKTGASVIVTHCPACLMQMRTCVKAANLDVQVVDLAEILNNALG